MAHKGHLGIVRVMQCCCDGVEWLGIDRDIEVLVKYCMSFVTVGGNLLVIISIIYFKQLHTPTNFLIFSLAVADLLVGIVVFPYSMAHSVSSCFYQESLFYRYYAVCQPLTYKTKINHHVVVGMILLSWVVSALIGISVIVAGLNNVECEDMCLTDILTNTIGTTLSFYLPVVIMLCIYLKIFLVAQRQARSIQSTVKTGETVSKMERKATKTLATVLGVFLFCWTPFFLCIMPFTNDSVPVPVIETLNWLTLSNSMLNPFIYAFFYRWFRSAFKMIVSGKIFQGDFANSKLY
ncbi:trace amine-associated receptor 1-like [Cololabis saira]|uniref:trace amine-associated receptor 1-like n=1 Tax=Cololabis saira TaxID=129043 RepID=UPI002AD422DF|nr:trace amine-associated receptor 1-like [Cololabis saira]